MSTIRDAIRRNKQVGDSNILGVLVKQTTEQVIADFLDTYRPEIIAQITKEVSQILPGAIQSIDQKAAAYLHNITPQLIGPKGDKGNSVQGPKGNDGSPGRDGKDAVGIQGPPGPAGNDGSPDTPDQIIDKANRATKKLSMQTIYGLPEELVAIKREVRKGGQKGGGGGGMGNVQHQHTAVSSATSTVVTSYRIAGQGFALWVYYNGQLLARGTDYTVGTDHKTLTLLFTPQDATIIDVIYIRT